MSDNVVKFPQVGEDGGCEESPPEQVQGFRGINVRFHADLSEFGESPPLAWEIPEGYLVFGPDPPTYFVDGSDFDTTLEKIGSDCRQCLSQLSIEDLRDDPQVKRLGDLILRVTLKLSDAREFLKEYGDELSAAAKSAFLTLLNGQISVGIDYARIKLHLMEQQSQTERRQSKGVRESNRKFDHITPKLALRKFKTVRCNNPGITKMKAYELVAQNMSKDELEVKPSLIRDRVSKARNL